MIIKIKKFLNQSLVGDKKIDRSPSWKKKGYKEKKKKLLQTLCEWGIQGRKVYSYRNGWGCSIARFTGNNFSWYKMKSQIKETSENLLVEDDISDEDIDFAENSIDKTEGEGSVSST